MWGSAWSAEQSEGRGETGKAETVWDRWFHEEPHRFYKRIGPSITTDHIHRYHEDIQLMKQTGHNSFRVSHGHECFQMMGLVNQTRKR